MKNKNFVMLASFVLVLIFLGVSAGNASSALEVHYIDVWQGDAVLIISPDGKTILIDAGGNYYGDEVITFMDSHNITSIDYMLSSHYHADHIGGSDYVLYYVPVGIVYDRGGTYGSQTFADYVEAAGDKRTTIGVGNTIDLGSGITFH